MFMWFIYCVTFHFKQYLFIKFAYWITTTKKKLYIDTQLNCKKEFLLFYSVCLSVCAVFFFFCFVFRFNFTRKLMGFWLTCVVALSIMAPQYCVTFYACLHPYRLNVQSLYHAPDRLNVLSVAIQADALLPNVSSIQLVPESKFKNKNKKFVYKSLSIER